MRAAAVLLALVLIAVACGDEGGEPVSTEAPDDGATTAAEEETTANETEAAGDEVAQFFAAEPATLAVIVDPGGGLDAGTRTLAPFLGEELGTQVNVENQPGGGGLVAQNDLVFTEPDGRTILLTAGTNLLAFTITQPENIEYELETLSYLGRVWFEPFVLYVREDAPFESVQDIVDAGGIKTGAAARGGSSWVDLMIFYEALGLEPDIVTGYDGTGETNLAMIRGEIDGTVNAAARVAADVEANNFRPIVTVADERYPLLPDVPTIFEAGLEFSEEQEAMLRTHINARALGRPIIAPPGVPDDRLAFLQDALERAVANPEFMEQMEADGRPVSFLSGPDFKELILDIRENLPDAYVELISIQE